MTGTSEYPVLGFDPAPGTVATVESVATDLQQVSTKMGDAHQALTKIGREDGIWEGQAADAFRRTVGELPKYLEQAHRSLGDAARTLTQWYEHLGSMQQKARSYEAEAAAAQQRVRQAESNPHFNLANQHFPDRASLQQAQSKLDAAQSTLNNANADLEAIREQATRLLHQHDDLAKTVEDALRRAADEAPEKPGLLERLGNALDQLGQSISDSADKAWQWIQDHADDLKQVGDVLSTVGSVLGVVALATSWIPGVNAVTAGAAMTVSAAALGVNALAKAGGADVSWGKIATDAVGVIPGGRILAGAKNAASQAAKVGLAAQSTGRAGRIGQAVTGTGKVTTESKVLKDVTGVGGKVDITPSTMAELKANPKEAIDNAATFTHTKSVELVNKIPNVNLDPFSNAGIAAGAGVGSVKKVAVAEGIDYASGQVESQIQQKTGVRP
ncbi:MAG: hypothetical protein IJH84_16405 [Saccharopolyspora sp.]|uniref:putative T7SS-secreted protein n=1 Tax=Saccharopolyspora TaxID=1835 RepID=UPI00190D253A|nr:MULTISPECIES: hypothetical protein [unclassified Saccharopolyspora]MBK0866441.1 hypothetical protein [Saccharopolyspora sp. HNM0986]MBQ6642595.1 hypothetical protein [Saccharopolyspora sp.]